MRLNWGTAPVGAFELFEICLLLLAPDSLLCFPADLLLQLTDLLLQLAATRFVRLLQAANLATPLLAVRLQVRKVTAGHWGGWQLATWQLLCSQSVCSQACHRWLCTGWRLATWRPICS